MKKIFFMTGVVALIAAVSICGTVLADDPGRVDCDPIALDGQWVEFTSGANVYSYCPVTMETNGLLSVSVQTFMTGYPDGCYVYLLDCNYEQVSYGILEANGPADPQTYTFQLDLTAGTYYCRVEARGDCEGDFRVKAETTPSQATEAEPNDTFDEPTPYTVGETARGFLSSTSDGWNHLEGVCQDTADVYSFTYTGGRCEIGVVSVETDGGNFECHLYDEGLEELEVLYANGTERESAEMDLSAGIYYAKIVANSSTAGDYLFCVTPEDTETESTTQTGTVVTEESEVVLDFPDETETSSDQSAGDDETFDLPSGNNEESELPTGSADSYADTIEYLEGTYVNDSMAITLTVEEDYAQDPDSHDFDVYVVYFDADGNVTSEDDFNLLNNGKDGGDLYNLVESQEGKGYNIIKTDDDTIQMRLNDNVLQELKSIELVDNAYTQSLK